jgi:hypothetical protein
MESIEGMDRPAHSSNLNPIEHMWNELQIRVSARQLQPIKELGAMLVKECRAISVRRLET